MAHSRGVAGGYLKATRSDLRSYFYDGTGRDRRDRGCDGPDLLCRGRYRQGPPGGSVQDRAAGGCRLLSRLTRSEGGFAQARRISAMADRLGAEQNLKKEPHVLRYRLQRRFPGWSRRTGVADCHIKQGTCRLARSLSALALENRGEKLAMSQTSTSQPPQIKSRLGAILRSTSGNFLEQFDFFLFGFYAPYIARAFFPSESETAALLNTFGVFWLGALMRPVGAIVLGAYIDRIGRRQGLIVTLAIMAMGTVFIAICPTYASIGIAAPIFVLVGRLLQGFSAGVELGGVSVYLFEISTPGNKGFYTSFQSASQQVAIFAAAIIGFALNEAVQGDTLVAFWTGADGIGKWRIPFFIGCLIIPFIFVLRRTLEETPAFLAMKKHPSTSEVFSSAAANWKIILL